MNIPTQWSWFCWLQPSLILITFPHVSTCLVGYSKKKKKIELFEIFYFSFGGHYFLRRLGFLVDYFRSLKVSFVIPIWLFSFIRYTNSYSILSHKKIYSCYYEIKICRVIEELQRRFEGWWRLLVTQKQKLLRQV